MKPGALGLFRHLTSVPTAPYYEKAVTRKALEWIARHLGSRARVSRRRGGVIVRYVGRPGTAALAFAAHLDHPAFKLSRQTRSGAAGSLEGGLPPHLLEGVAVEAFAAVPRDNVPLARGVLGKAESPGRYPIRWTSPPRTGARPAFATLALTPYSVEGPWLSSRSIDDLLGCAVSLEAMRRLARARAKVNVTVLLHRAEEVGFMGALDLIAEGAVDPRDTVLSIESSRQLPGARPGKGPVIRLGDKATVFDGNAVALLDEAAAGMRARGQAVQRLRLTGGTCEATAYLAFGYESGGVAVPLVNYHNGWGAKRIAPERVRLEDVAGAVTLLERAARLFHGEALRGTLRRRLEDRHRLNRRRL